MGTSVRRSALWLALAALAIAVIALFTTGVGAAPGTNAGAVTDACDPGTGVADAAFTGLANAPDCVDGNVQEGAPSCVALNFPDALELSTSPAAGASDGFVTGTLVGDGKYLDITAGPDVTVLGAVIKGGNDANLYWGDLEGLHSPLTNSGNLPAISHWTICYELEAQPEPQDVKIKKHQVGGPAAEPFDFLVFCDDELVSGVIVAGGSEQLVEVPGDAASCEVLEVNVLGGTTTLADWTTVPSSRSVTHPLGDDGPVVFEFTNTYIERPDPEGATVRVTKVFEGPSDWEFGFGFICEDFGNADVFALGGGDSAHFEVPFDYPQAGDLVPAEEQGLLCGVYEEPLLGDWTVNILVTGAEVAFEEQSEVGSVVVFGVYPGADINVTFENIPGYAAKPPTGVTPDIFAE